MHILIGLITAITGLLYALDRLNVDLGGLNPFSWWRRRKWMKRYEGDPVYATDDPLEIAAIALVGIAKVDGDITAEKKQRIEQVFAETFAMGETDAHQLLISSSHLLGAPQVVATQVQGLLKRTAKSFSDVQAGSVVSMIDDIYQDELSTDQRELRVFIRDIFKREEPASKDW